MIKPIVVVGAGRQGRNIVEVLEDGKAGPVAGFLDDTKPAGETVLGHPVLNGFAAMRDAGFVRAHSWIVAVGDNLIRKNLCRGLADAGAIFVCAIHQAVHLSRTAVLGRGVYVGPFSSVGANSTIGDWAVLQANVRVGVDIRVGEASFLAPGVIITGGGSVGAGSVLGAGAVLSNDVSVGDDCVVGANSLVLRDLPNGTTAYGTPARPAALTPRPFEKR
jgi:sugar O-acyltransferase (sialic acid O-acetyltransferase NeuD family)